MNTLTSGRAVAPLRIEVRQQSRLLDIEWEDGVYTSLAFRELRARCKCAECLVGDVQVAPDIGVKSLNEIGPNALQFHFSDGHSRGIYPFAYLRNLGRR